MALIGPDGSSELATASSTAESSSSAMQRNEAGFSTDGLPKAFLQSLRTLFDILDDSRRGYVHISEIESRWQGAETRELPGGVLECLRKVAPGHGCLSFERFVAGLRFSLLNPENKHQASLLKQHQQAPRQKTHPQHGSTANSGRGNENSVNKVRPLGPSNSNGPNPHLIRPRHNEKPQAHALYSSSLSAEHPSERKPATAAVPGVRYASNGRSLERIPVLHEVGPHRSGKQQQRVRSTESLALESGQPPRSGALEGASMPRSQSETVTGLAAVQRHGRGRDEQRRHTITSGVDYGMLKRMKELEQEKDSLLQGLEMVEHAREWYHQQVQAVQERQKHMGQHSSSNDFFSEASQSRLTHLLPKLQDVNRCLGDLMSSSGQPCTSSPSAPNGLAPPAASNPQHTTSSLANPHQAINMLKDQNRLLTKEVTDKSERITQLEQEKSALIKQLFEARARSNHETSALDSTFI
ncbi:suppressor APC domain-containing protein 2 [Polyodon spathula]|uniref:suppressor APC domain-containing protein 2 n=1 Tax=Polyodon spathula TaxID=7913 RepID=UPI001B7EAA2F|nr:suppressor APC domain-containing protein 2 [Polyodon spathula]